MFDGEDTPPQDVEELAQLRQRVAELERQLAHTRQVEEGHKRTEEALRESERQLSTLIANLPGAVFRCRTDPDFTVDFISDGLFALTGYDPATLCGQPGTRYCEQIHPEDRQRAMEVMQEAFAQKKQFRVEYRIRTASGEEKWLWEQGVGIYSEDGQLEAIEGFTTDITPLKHAELAVRKAREELEFRVEERTAQLAEANRKLVTTLESITDGFVSFDHQWRYTYVNPAAASFLNTTPDELCGKLLWEVYPEVRRLPFLEQFQRAVAEQSPVHFEEFYPAPLNGWYECHCYPSAEGMSMCFRDVTDRRIAQESLRQQEAKYRALVESSPNAIVMCGLDDRILFASQQTARWHGLDDPGQLVGQCVTDLVVPEERELMQANIRRLIQDGLRQNDEYRGLRTDGTTFSAEVSASVIRDASGQPVAYMGVYRDVSERKQAQAALHSEQEALRRMLQASDRERELITFEIHDGVAQQLLGALMQFESFWQLESHDSDQAQAAFEAGLAALRQASAEARSLMNQTHTPVLQKFGVKAAIADLIDQFSERPGAPEIMYRCEVQFKRLAPVLENTVFRVAQELIANACVHSQAECVRVSLVQDGDEVTLEVEDNGIGFDTDRVVEGRFGLDGIRERVRLLGKQLTVDSGPGRGARIRAAFPTISANERTDSNSSR